LNLASLESIKFKSYYTHLYNNIKIKLLKSTVENFLLDFIAVNVD